MSDDVAVLMTRRAETLRGHPGMMAFPGGRLEEDETWVEGSLRGLGLPASNGAGRLRSLRAWLATRTEASPSS